MSPRALIGTVPGAERRLKTHGFNNNTFLRSQRAVPPSAWRRLAWKRLPRGFVTVPSSRSPLPLSILTAPLFPMPVASCPVTGCESVGDRSELAHGSVERSNSAVTCLPGPFFGPYMVQTLFLRIPVGRRLWLRDPSVQCLPLSQAVEVQSVCRVCFGAHRIQSPKGESWRGVGSWLVRSIT